MALKKTDYVKDTIPIIKFGNHLNELVSLMFVPLQNKNTMELTDKVWNEIQDQLFSLVSNVALQLPFGTWEGFQTFGILIAFTYNSYNLWKYKRDQDEQRRGQDLELDEQVDP